MKLKMMMLWKEKKEPVLLIDPNRKRFPTVNSFDDKKSRKRNKFFFFSSKNTSKLTLKHSFQPFFQFWRGKTKQKPVVALFFNSRFFFVFQLLKFVIRLVQSFSFNSRYFCCFFDCQNYFFDSRYLRCFFSTVKVIFLMVDVFLGFFSTKKIKLRLFVS